MEDRVDKRRLMPVIDKIIESGYLHQGYAESLSDFGALVKLSKSDGWILKRHIPGYSYYDGMGCYPLFACKNWSLIREDIEDLKNELICLSLITDPFGDFDLNNIKKIFSSTVPFKEHLVADLNQPINDFISGHHKRYAQKSLANISVEYCKHPVDFFEEWLILYDNLINRHNIKGIPAFSKSSFLKQLQVPGIDVFRAICDDKTIGMILWYSMGNIAYYHLGAYNDLGYKMRASFALFWKSIEYYKSNGIQWLNLGAGSGTKGNNIDGLTKFKQGWSTGTRTAYFCSRIFHEELYSEIVQAKGIPSTNYFPAYRYGEFS